MRDETEKICSRFSEALSNKMDFLAFRVERDYPPVWDFKITLTARLPHFT